MKCVNAKKTLRSNSIYFGFIQEENVMHEMTMISVESIRILFGAKNEW